MFEKEAKEYGDNYVKSKYMETVDETWRKGAEFGYNKGKSEWHYVKDNDLPDNCRYVWTNVGAGYHDEDGWWDDFGRLYNVVAWCEPELELELKEVEDDN